MSESAGPPRSPSPLHRKPSFVASPWPSTKKDLPSATPTTTEVQLKKMIPPLNEHGLLPIGIYGCSLAEIEERFGSFQTNDRRPVLFQRLNAYLNEAKSTQQVLALLIDGSFVTAKASPGDIDIVLIASGDFSPTDELKPFAYNVFSKKRVARLYGFDIVAVVEDDTAEYAKSVVFFQQVKDNPALKKGILRVNL